MRHQDERWAVGSFLCQKRAQCLGLRLPPLPRTEERIERRQWGEGLVGWYTVRIDDPERSAEISAAIDAEFANSQAETKAEPEGAWIQFDLGTVYKLHQVHIWNHNTQTEAILGYGIKDALIETSTDGTTWVELKTVTLTQASGKATYTGEDVALDGVIAQYVKITALSNFSILGLKQVGLSEVEFSTVPVLAREPMAGATDVILWGAGQTGRRISKYLREEGVEISRVVDIDPVKIGGTLRGIPVIAPKDLPGHLGPDTVVLAAVASRGARKLIRARLVELGLVEGHGFWCVA